MVCLLDLLIIRLVSFIQKSFGSWLAETWVSGRQRGALMLLREWLRIFSDCVFDQKRSWPSCPRHHQPPSYPHLTVRSDSIETKTLSFTSTAKAFFAVDPINCENHWYSNPIKKEPWQSHRHEKLSIAPQVHCQYLIVVFVCTWTLNNKGRWRGRRTFICQAMISDRLSGSKLQPSVVHQLRWPFVYFESFTWLMSLIHIVGQGRRFLSWSNKLI